MILLLDDYKNIKDNDDFKIKFSKLIEELEKSSVKDKNIYFFMKD